jgi:transcriptional regulator with XRE-family HTH domain
MGRGKRARALTVFDMQASYAMRILRWRYPPMQRFATDLGHVLERDSLSRQTIYQWESGRTSIPASVLIAASELVGMPLDEVLSMAHRMATVSRPSEHVNG